jgi:anti-sigma factor RsiW
MSCEIWRGKLEPYVDSELAENEIAGLEAHLRVCSSCAADALGRLQMKRMTQAAGSRFAPTPHFRLHLEQSLAARQKRGWAFGWAPKLALAATALLLLIASAGLWQRHASREQAVSQLADLHVATLASPNPVDVVSSDRHTVKPWFAGKLPFTFNLPELQNSPFTLAGGRVTYFRHTPGAQLIYNVRKHQISVFIFQDQSGFTRLGSGPSVARELAFNVETWAEGGLRYFVLGDAGPADINELAKLFRQTPTR